MPQTRFASKPPAGSSGVNIVQSPTSGSPLPVGTDRIWTSRTIPIFVISSVLQFLPFQRPSQGDRNPFNFTKHSDEYLLWERKGSARSKKQKYLTGWRMGVTCSLLLAICVLLFDVFAMVWIVSQHEIVNGSGSIFRGGCDQAKAMNTQVQIGINVLSTLLLSASNYCMQCLGAPTREEVDEAHARKNALFIGVPAAKNLKSINRSRAFVWIMLGLSALPVHFLYNSVLFQETQGARFHIIAGPETLLSPDFNGNYSFSNQTSPPHEDDYSQIIPCLKDGCTSTDFSTACINNSNTNGWQNLSSLGQSPTQCYDLNYCAGDLSAVAQKMRTGIATGVFEYLDVHECQKEYAQQYLSRRGDLLLVQNRIPLYGYPPSSNQQDCGLASWYSPMSPEDEDKAIPYLVDPQFVPSYIWDCPLVANETNCNATTLSKAIKSRELWTPFGDPVQYCLSQRISEECTLVFNAHIAYAAIVSTFVKALCMGYTLVAIKGAALMNIGDAIESFINRPDQHTAGMSTFSADRLNLLWQQQRIADALPDVLGGSTKQKALDKLLFQVWDPKSLRWWRAATPSRYFCFILFFFALGAGLGSIATIMGSDGSINIGLGTQPGLNYINLQPPLLTSVLIANSPQLLCSYIFLGFNYLLTCMLTGREWMSFSHRRRSLRVTYPAGEQHSTYYLQLPYRFSIPLQIMSALMSWLTSQILFVVRVRFVNGYTVDEQDSAGVHTCGYSPGAIVITVIVGTALALTVLLLCMRKYPNTMPLAGTNSAAIAAACHALPEDRESIMQPLQWGVVSQKGGVGHCSFSAGVVAPLIPGRMYR